MKNVEVSKEKLNKVIQKAKNAYKKQWPGITKYFNNKNWFEEEFKNIIPYWTSPLYGKFDEDKRVLDLLFEEMKIIEKVFNKADVVKMPYKERMIFWDDLKLDYRTIYRFEINSKDFDFNVFPKSRLEMEIYVQFFWNRLKIQTSKTNFDIEAYKEQIIEKAKKIETPYEGSFFYKYEIEMLKDSGQMYKLRSIAIEEIDIGCKIAVRKADDDMFQLYHKQFTEERIFGYVFTKKWIFINSLKNGEIKFNEIKPKPKKREPLFLTNVWEGERDTYDKCIKFLQKESAIIRSPFLIQDNNGQLRWCKMPKKGWVQFLRAFFMKCMESKLILQNNYSGGVFIEIAKNTFNVRPHKDAFIDMVTDPDEKYSKPFVAFFKNL